MKKIILFSLAVVLVFSGVFGGLMWWLNPAINAPKEELIPCHATIDDDFAEGKVLIILNTKGSRLHRNLTIEDFKIDGITGIKELWTYTNEEWKIADRYWRAQKISQTLANNVLKNNGYEQLNPDSYQSMYVLYLADETKEGVLQAIKNLENANLDFLLCAEPSYVIHLFDKG